MTWHISLFQLGLAIVVLGLSCIIIMRRKREVREGVPTSPVSQGGSPEWLWVMVAVWAALSLLIAAAMLVTGHAAIDF